MDQPPAPQRRGAIAIALTLTTMLAACDATLTQPPRPLAGCYRLETSVPLGSMSELDALPDSVRLLEARGVTSLESGRAILRAYPDSMRTSYRFSWWEVAAPDTLALVFSTGLSGVRLAMRSHGDGYVGTIAAFNDPLTAPHEASRAWLTPIACTGWRGTGP